jgi:hypothetical protein
MKPIQTLPCHVLPHDSRNIGDFTDYLICCFCRLEHGTLRVADLFLS